MASDFKKKKPAIFVPDEDLCGRNVVLLQYTVLREMLEITNDICSRSHELISLQDLPAPPHLIGHCYNT